MTVAETALAVMPPPSLPAPTFRGAQMIEALHAYRELQTALDRAMPDQLLTLDGKTFRKKGYWRAVAVAFNLTVQPTTREDDERRVVSKLDDGSDNYVYAVTYRAISTSGRAATGDGTCAAAEKSRGKLRATEHNVRSHAHTRAFNRAVSNLVGFGEVSAEEIDERHERPERETPRKVAAAGTITVEQRAALFGLAKGAHWSEDDLRAWLKSAHNVEKTSTITQQQYAVISEHLRALAAAARGDPDPETGRP